MKAFGVFSLMLMLLIFSSCESDISPEKMITSPEMPGKFIHEMALDNNGEFFFVTSEVDTSVEVPLWSSTIPFKNYFSNRKTETSEFEILDDDFMGISNINFDSRNRLWGLGGKNVYFWEGSQFQSVLELTGEDEALRALALDQDDNVWVGTYPDALYKISSDLNVSQFTSTNSLLPQSNYMSIHVDKNNVVWISLDNNGVLRISGEVWQWYNSTNSDITTQRIWCITSDKDENIWIGTGFTDESITLMKFNGSKWQVVKPRDEKNNVLSGSVRKLFSDNEKIYVVTVQIKNAAFLSNQLLSFDGNKWDRIKEIPEDVGIEDMIFDDFRDVIWVRTLNDGIFKLERN